MFYLHSTTKWVDEVVKRINERQLRPEESRFMIAFFSSMDRDFVNYFRDSKEQISSFSGRNFHIFTPLIFENEIIPDEEWRYMRREFQSFGIPVNVGPTFVFFKLELKNDRTYEPVFFAGFECGSFNKFPEKIKYAIDIAVNIENTQSLQEDFQKFF